MRVYALEYTCTVVVIVLKKIMYCSIWFVRDTTECKIIINYWFLRNAIVIRKMWCNSKLNRIWCCVKLSEELQPRHFVYLCYKWILFIWINVLNENTILYHNRVETTACWQSTGVHVIRPSSPLKHDCYNCLSGRHNVLWAIKGLRWAGTHWSF